MKKTSDFYKLTQQYEIVSEQQKLQEDLLEEEIIEVSLDRDSGSSGAKGFHSLQLVLPQGKISFPGSEGLFGLINQMAFAFKKFYKSDFQKIYDKYDLENDSTVLALAAFLFPELVKQPSLDNWQRAVKIIAGIVTEMARALKLPISQSGFSGISAAAKKMIKEIGFTKFFNILLNTAPGTIKNRIAPLSDEDKKTFAKTMFDL